MKTKTSIAALAAVALTASANAAVVGITNITYTGTATELGGLNLDDENQIINGSGLVDLTGGALEESDITGALVTHDAVVFSNPGNAWTTTDPGGSPSDFFASTQDIVIFELTLDNTYNLTDLASWGYHFGTLNNNDISEITIDYGVGNFTDGSIAGLAIAQAGIAGDAVVTSLGAPVQANQLRITVTDNHYDAGNAGAGGDRIGVAELRFIGTAVPEPSSTALLGLGGLALLMRRRK